MSRAAHAIAKKLRLELVSKKYDDLIDGALKRLAEAPSSRRQELAAAYGGVLRSIRSTARVSMASALMRELDIKPTITVAKFVMRQVFGEAVGSDTLLEHFASERTAAQKVMAQARATLASEKAAASVAAFSEAYQKYLKALNERAAKIKALHSC